MEKKDEEKSPNYSRDSNHSDGEVHAFIFRVADIHDEWILDSACKYHM